MDGRVKPGHDGVCRFLAFLRETSAFSERRFDLADFIKVVGARLENGLLHITLKREVPEAMKPKSIPIESGSPTLIEAKKAA